MELSLLCDVNILLVIVDNESSTYISYNSDPSKEIILEPERNAFKRLMKYTNENFHDFDKNSNISEIIKQEKNIQKPVNRKTKLKKKINRKSIKKAKIEENPFPTNSDKIIEKKNIISLEEKLKEKRNGLRIALPNEIQNKPIETLTPRISINSSLNSGNIFVNNDILQGSISPIIPLNSGYQASQNFSDNLRGFDTPCSSAFRFSDFNNGNMLDSGKK